VPAMKRTDVVVAAALVPGLRIPALAVTDGAADPDWVEVPLSRWPGKPYPTQRLPMDRRSANNLRRLLWLEFWTVPIGVAAAAVWAAGIIWPMPLSVRLLAICSAMALGVLTSWARTETTPLQMPYRTRFGELRIPDVPEQVADAWVADNPGVIATDEPAPRPHSRGFYAGWAAVLLSAAVALAVVMATDAREDSLLFWMLLPALSVTGLVTAWKTRRRPR
jgi:hypothetical protein